MVPWQERYPIVTRSYWLPSNYYDEKTGQNWCCTKIVYNLHVNLGNIRWNLKSASLYNCEKMVVFVLKSLYQLNFGLFFLLLERFSGVISICVF